MIKRFLPPSDEVFPSFQRWKPPLSFPPSKVSEKAPAWFPESLASFFHGASPP